LALVVALIGWLKQAEFARCLDPLGNEHDVFDRVSEHLTQEEEDNSV